MSLVEIQSGKQELAVHLCLKYIWSFVLYKVHWIFYELKSETWGSYSRPCVTQGHDLPRVNIVSEYSRGHNPIHATHTAQFYSSMTSLWEYKPMHTRTRAGLANTNTQLPYEA